MQYFSRGSDKYTEIKMCDLELFSKIRSHIYIDFCVVMCVMNIRLVSPSFHGVLVCTCLNWRTCLNWLHKWVMNFLGEAATSVASMVRSYVYVNLGHC